MDSKGAGYKPKRQILHPKRTKGGRVPGEVSQDELHELFHLPMESAATRLGVGLTVLKQICRKYGIARWPFRKVLQLKRLASIVKDPQSLVPIITEMHVPLDSKLWDHFDGKCREKINKALRSLEQVSQHQVKSEEDSHPLLLGGGPSGSHGGSGGGGNNTHNSASSPTSTLDALMLQQPSPPISDVDFDDDNTASILSAAGLGPEFMASMQGMMMPGMMHPGSMVPNDFSGLALGGLGPHHAAEIKAEAEAAIAAAATGADGGGGGSGARGATSPLWQHILSMAACAANGISSGDDSGSPSLAKLTAESHALLGGTHLDALHHPFSMQQPGSAASLAGLGGNLNQYQQHRHHHTAQQQQQQQHHHSAQQQRHMMSNDLMGLGDSSHLHHHHHHSQLAGHHARAGRQGLGPGINTLASSRTGNTAAVTSGLGQQQQQQQHLLRQRWLAQQERLFQSLSNFGE